MSLMNINWHETIGFVKLTFEKGRVNGPLNPHMGPKLDEQALFGSQNVFFLNIFFNLFNHII